MKNITKNLVLVGEEAKRIKYKYTNRYFIEPTDLSKIVFKKGMVTELHVYKNVKKDFYLAKLKDKHKDLTKGKLMVKYLD